MPKPKEVFDNPREHWSFITADSDDTFEGQHFDRKQVGRESDSNVSKGQIDDLRNHIKSCISAFGNVNKDGGLLVIGVSQTGQALGIGNLKEAQQNQLTDIDSLMRNHLARCSIVDCKNAEGDDRTVLLIYSAFVERAICETVDRTPLAWARHGKQNVVLTEQAREQIRRDKQIVEFELNPCCKFEPSDLDKDVLQQFKKTYLEKARDPDWSDERLLYEVGAILRGDKEEESGCRKSCRAHQNHCLAGRDDVV